MNQQNTVVKGRVHIFSPNKGCFSDKGCHILFPNKNRMLILVTTAI